MQEKRTNNNGLIHPSTSGCRMRDPKQVSSLDEEGRFRRRFSWVFSFFQSSGGKVTDDIIFNLVWLVKENSVNFSWLKNQSLFTVFLLNNCPTYAWFTDRLSWRTKLLVYPILRTPYCEPHPVCPILFIPVWTAHSLQPLLYCIIKYLVLKSDEVNHKCICICVSRCVYSASP